MLERVEDVPPSVTDLLLLSRSGFEMFQDVQKKLLDALRGNDLIMGVPVFCFYGVLIGGRFGHLFESKIEILGGLILIGIGAKILLEHLGY